jgi:hypothetical protein
MQIVGTDNPLFFKAAAVMREYLPHIEFLPHCKIVFDDGRYYGLITPNGNTVNYDHVILDKMVCNPEIIFIIITTIFKFGSIVNTFIDKDNVNAQRFVRGIGFTNTGYLRQEPQPLAIWSMTIDEWQENKIRKHFIEQTQKPEEPR